MDLRGLGLIAQLLQLAAMTGAGLAIIAAHRRGLAGARLVALGAALGAPIALFTFLVSDTVWAFEDFREAYWKAGAAVWDGPGALRPMLERGIDGFVNLPIVAYLFAPFGLMSPRLASLAFLALGVIAMGVSVLLLVRLFRLGSRETALSLVGLAGFGPLLYSAREGNTSHILIALLLLALLMMRRNRDFAAGVVLGLAALIKLPLLLTGVFFLLKGRLRIVAGGAALLLGAAAASLAVFGWDMHVLWYEACIAPFGRDPMAAFNVQSIAATLAKLQLGAGSLNDWTPHMLHPAWRIAAQAVNLALVAALAWVALRGRSDQDAQTLEAEFLAVIVLACLLSPLSWSHYYVWLVLPAAFLLGRLAAGELSSRARLLLGLAWLGACPAIFWYEPKGYGLIAVLANLHLLASALAIYGLILAWRGSRSPGA